MLLPFFCYRTQRVQSLVLLLQCIWLCLQFKPGGVNESKAQFLFLMKCSQSQALIPSTLLSPFCQVTHRVEVVHCTRDNDSIGAVICKRAEQLQAAVVMMAKHNKGALRDFFVGSATTYVNDHAVCPVIVMNMGWTSGLLSKQEA
jgi:hypothetical protein